MLSSKLEILTFQLFGGELLLLIVSYVSLYGGIVMKNNTCDVTAQIFSGVHLYEVIFKKYEKNAYIFTK